MEQIKLSLSVFLQAENLHTRVDGSLQMEHALLFTFLEVSSDCNFREQLHSLHSPQIMWCRANDDDELQTDGNRSGRLQNVSLRLGHAGPPTSLRDVWTRTRKPHPTPGNIQGVAPTNEEVIRLIAARLAEIGDQFDKEIQGRVVNDLVEHYRNESLSNEEIMRHMSRVLGELIRAIPSDMEQERAKLVLAMHLAKKIMNTVPSLVQRVFTTTVNYLNQQFHDYIADMLGE